MSDFITGQGVPPQVIQIENVSSSTHENALFVAGMLAGDPRRKVLLTSDFHMKRALAAFRRAGVDPVPLPIPDARKRFQFRMQRWDVFGALLQETEKFAYYKVRGWV
jgi:uncharacterized SAM-binding protein YcdF (DUF218 family)